MNKRSLRPRKICFNILEQQEERAVSGFVCLPRSCLETMVIERRVDKKVDFAKRCC